MVTITLYSLGSPFFPIKKYSSSFQGDGSTILGIKSVWWFLIIKKKPPNTVYTGIMPLQGFLSVPAESVIKTVVKATALRKKYLHLNCSAVASLMPPAKNT